MPDGSFQTNFPTHPDAVVPHLEVNDDTGKFVYAVSKLPPGGTYMAAGTFCSWTDFMKTWSKVTNKPATYKQVTTEELANSMDRAFGEEIGDMFDYSTKPGYDGAMSPWTAEDITKVSSLLFFFFFVKSFPITDVQNSRLGWNVACQHLKKS